MNGRIALFLHQPSCSVQSGNGIINALSDHYTFKIFTRHQVEDDFFDNVDCICVPGGIGDADTYDRLMINHQETIRNFVAKGGKYLGICMGAYWTGQYYFNFLKEIDCVQYIKRPGALARRPHAKNLTVQWQGSKTKMFFYDGCAIVGDLSQSNIYATYTNGDAMAVIHKNIGMIGCHPEAEPHWYQEYSWLRSKYQNNKNFLLNFVNDLVL